MLLLTGDGGWLCMKVIWERGADLQHINLQLVDWIQMQAFPPSCSRSPYFSMLTTSRLHPKPWKVFNILKRWSSRQHVFQQLLKTVSRHKLLLWPCIRGRDTGTAKSIASFLLMLHFYPWPELVWPQFSGLLTHQIELLLIFFLDSPQKHWICTLPMQM